MTNFGKIADPIADKAITGMAFIGPRWSATSGGGSRSSPVREWSVTLLRLSVLKHVVIAAAQSGKVKTTLQAIALAGLCLPLRQVDGALDTIGNVLFYVSQVAACGRGRDDALVGVRVLPDAPGAAGYPSSSHKSLSLRFSAVVAGHPAG